MVQNATQIHTVIGLVGAGLGVAVVPQTACNLHPEQVRFVRLTDPPEFVHVALAWRRGHETPAIRSFRRVTEQVVESFGKRNAMRTAAREKNSKGSAKIAKENLQKFS